MNIFIFFICNFSTGSTSIYFCALIPKENFSSVLEQLINREAPVFGNMDVISVCIRFFSEGRKEGMFYASIK